ncbi:MAG: patatin-like phospholipase family protein [Kiritimatiellae bacterium]|nr:patatin-like phospholipase family protein [Kiritimatiellia bacterium]MDD4735335.1 patatin-like phospholipase family protein [Kiritimatiellia bacterium]
MDKKSPPSKSVISGRLGVALGGGGVRGFAHALVLEMLDELGLRPAIIAGTSMGAVVGALYASGVPGRKIKERILRHTISRSAVWKEVLEKKSDLLNLFNAISLELGRGGLLSTDRFLKYVFREMQDACFEDMQIPLLVIAADYWRGEEVILRSGALLPAVKASMAVPGVFAPVKLDGRILLDGGIVNQVPYDHLKDCDVTIAVDVTSERLPDKEHPVPNLVESILGSFEIMQEEVIKRKLKESRPTFYLHPHIQDVGVFDFDKVEEVFEQSQPAVDSLRQELTHAMKLNPKELQA